MRSREGLSDSGRERHSENQADRRRTAGAPETAGVSSSVKTDSGNQEPDDHDERCLLEEMYDALADAG